MDTRVEVVPAAGEAVAKALAAEQQRSCVFGARLLCGLFEEIGIAYQPIGVLLKVTTPSLAWLLIGRPSAVPYPVPLIDVGEGGFAGHVVVLANFEEASWLVDPTAFQVAALVADRGLVPPAKSITKRLPHSDELSLEEGVAAVVSGWSYKYDPDPEVDWTKRPEWIEPFADRFSRAARRNYSTSTGHEFALPPERNSPCPCDSGRKFKHCCIRSTGDRR